MSRLLTTFRNATAYDCRKAAEAMFFQREFPRRHMNKYRYVEIAQAQIEGAPAAVVADAVTGRQVAWLVYDIDYDLHMPDRGAVVYHLVLDRDYPHALRVLMRDFLAMLREQGCSWYQTTRRENETTFVSTFKRL